MTAAELSELRALLETAHESLAEASDELLGLLPVLTVLPHAPSASRVYSAMSMATAALRDARTELVRLSGHSVKVSP